MQAEWVCAIDQKFGAAALLHTCCADNMPAAELLDFLRARGQFTGTEQSMALDAAAIWNH